MLRGSADHRPVDGCVNQRSSLGQSVQCTLEDIFDLQDQVIASVVGAMVPKLEQAEIERARRKPTENLDAYDYFLRGMASAHQLSPDGIAGALQMYARAIELDRSRRTPLA